MKKLIIAFIALGLFAFPVSAFAKTTSKVVVKPVATSTPTPAPVDSFELFWPMTAGKTMQSKIYFLKTLKEKIRGIFIFGSAQKADYDIFLGIKRMLEAEVLMKANVEDLANQTLDNANSEVGKAADAWNSAKNSGDIDQNTKDEINGRVTNLKKFLPSLINQYPSYKDKLQSILDKLNSLSI